MHLLPACSPGTAAPRRQIAADAALQSAAIWDAAALRQLLTSNFREDQLIVVSNREPHVHERVDGVSTVTQPAGGLVTALEPLLRASGGTWIACGSGNADREGVDARDGWRVLPAGLQNSGHGGRDSDGEGDGSYRLRRVWLSAREVRSYGDGFANAGLWPLCHTAQVEPLFSVADWACYCAVNQRFADVVVAEAQRADPIVLIQDYHLALVPALVRRQLPLATIASFWHVPWAHPQRMAMCPWLAEILDGLLGSDVVGFQTPQHRHHFIASVSATLDAGPARTRVRTDADTDTDADADVHTDPHGLVHWRGRRTLVKDCPISIAWPVSQAPAPRSSPMSSTLASSVSSSSTVAACRRAAFTRWGLAIDAKLIIGVDRFDYTKGLLERVRAVEQLLLAQPHWQARLRFVQIAAPTRSTLPHYARFRDQVVAEVARVNARFASAGDAPIVLIERQHDRAAVDALYRAADVCLVTSLHDGMNLVCKEFVAARDDGYGVLVLSQFAGAAHELTDALIVNPYDTAEVARAIDLGLSMPVSEQRRRMTALRRTVRRANVHRWAARVLLDAAGMRGAREAWSGGEVQGERRGAGSDSDPGQIRRSQRA